jgi:hypothetical protein
MERVERTFMFNGVVEEEDDGGGEASSGGPAYGIGGGGWIR